MDTPSVGASPFLADLFRQTTGLTASTQANLESNPARRMTFNSNVHNVNFNLRGEDSKQSEEYKQAPQMNY